MSGLEPSARDNLRLLPRVFPWVRVYGVIRPDKAPLAMGYWELFFPEHCRARDTFFAGVVRDIVRGNECWRPALLILCTHFEYGDELRDWERISSLIDILAYETLSIGAEDTVTKPYMLCADFAALVTPRETHPYYGCMGLRDAIHEVARIARPLPPEKIPFKLIEGMRG